MLLSGSGESLRRQRNRQGRESRYRLRNKRFDDGKWDLVALYQDCEATPLLLLNEMSVLIYYSVRSSRISGQLSR